MRKMVSENPHGRSQNAENGFGFDIFRAIPQTWQLIPQPYRTADEICVTFVNVQTKLQSKKLIHTHTHTPNKSKKFKQMMSARKLMGTVFWDRKGVLMEELVQQGTIITSDMHCETLKILRMAIQNKWHGMLIFGVLLVHDNARPHTSTAARTRALVEHFNWELFVHPPYSPDLASSDYHLFTYPKNWLGSQRYNNNEELMENVKT
jgi:histone-lysine N-methyltransferase SETMAR